MLVLGCLSYHTDGLDRKSVSANNSHSGRDPHLRFFRIVKGGTEVSLEPAGSPLPSAPRGPRPRHHTSVSPVLLLVSTWMSHNTWRNEMCSESNSCLLAFPDPFPLYQIKLDLIRHFPSIWILGNLIPLVLWKYFCCVYYIIF